MTLRTWTIELRVDFDGKEKEEIMLKAMRSAAKGLITTATLIADTRKPDIALSSSDMFVGAEEISMFEDGELESGL
ncbi:hypothetical protein [Bradyrhizobium cenepequi]